MIPRSLLAALLLLQACASRGENPNGNERFGVRVGEAPGLAFAPLLRGEELSGVNLALFGAKSSGRMTGLNLATIGTSAEKELLGFQGGLMIGGGGDIGFLNLGAVAITPFRLSDLDGPHDGNLWGLNVGGVLVDYPRATGLTLSGVVRAPRITGVSVAYGWNESSHRVEGLTIAPGNFAHDLYGVQLGLVNYVGSNPFPFQWLPLMNFRFADTPTDDDANRFAAR